VVSDLVFQVLVPALQVHLETPHSGEAPAGAAAEEEEEEERYEDPPLGPKCCRLVPTQQIVGVKPSPSN